MDINKHGDREDRMEEEEIPGGYPESFSLSGSWDGGNFLPRKPGGSSKYRECLKNHAVGIGGNAVDGCCEFMAAGEEGTLDGLRCAACGCHRNFHRKETAAGQQVYGHHHQYSPYLRAAPQYHSGYLTAPPHQLLHPRPLALPSTLREDLEEEEEEDASNRGMSDGGRGSGSGVIRKRSRTKFTAEQKERMREFAERVGWRMQKQDKAAVERFCSEIGVERQALKVWMHNHKHVYAHLMVAN